MPVNKTDIVSRLIDLGLQGRDVEAHSSLRSFGHVAGGAQTVVDALLEVCGTVLMPAFHSTGRSDPPADDRPRLNGWDYENQHVPVTDQSPFNPDTFGVDSDISLQEMGIIPVTLMQQPGTLRSVHPSVSWVANGAHASEYVSGHPSDDPNIIMRRLHENRGYVLLLGVTLNRCTSIHLAEELAGAKTLIRWARYKDGEIRRFRESGCSAAFDNLSPYLSEHLTTALIGRCKALCYPLEQMIPAAAAALRNNRQLVVCDAKGICRCRDTAAGGPVDL